MRLSLRYQLLLISSLTLVVYYPVIFSGFNPVDDQKLIDSLINTSGFNIKELFLPGGGYYYRPLLMLSFFVDNFLWDMSTSFMHLENILLHLFNGLLVFFLSRRLFDFFGKESRYYPLIASLLFVLHPVNTESVSWLSGRTDILALFFVLLSFLCLVQSIKKQSIFIMLVALVVFFLGCLAKESALFYYAGALALVYALHFNDRRGTFLNHAYACLPSWMLWSCVVAAYLFFRRFALASGDSGISHVVKTVTGNEALGATAVDHFDQVRIAFKVMGFYLKKIIVPWPLNFAIINVSDMYVLLGCLLLLLIVWLLYRTVRQGSVSAALLLGSIGMASSALLVALGNMAWTPIAERYLYMSSASFCAALPLALGLNLRWRYQKSSLSAFAVICLLLVFAGTTLHRAYIWSDPVRFLEDTIEKSPEFIPAYNDLAALYYAKGEHDKAMNIYAWAADKVGEKEYVHVDVNVAYFLAEEGNYSAARKILHKRLENSGKQYALVAQTLIVVNLKAIADGVDETPIIDIKKENVELLESLVKGSSDPFLRYRLGKAYLALDDFAKASENFDYAYRHAPDDSHYKEPARILAVKSKERASEHLPENP